MTPERMVELLTPYWEAPLVWVETAGCIGAGVPMATIEEIAPRLEIFLALLLRWNARTNLTAIREPEAIVQRHFGESLLGARLLAGFLDSGAAVLDFGSGAGFPGIPLQLAMPGVRVTLAESQNKKAAFLREAVRVLDLPAAVWAERVEAMPARTAFSAVTLRAVDRMGAALQAGSERVRPGGVLLVYGGGEPVELGTAERLAWVDVPGSERSWIGVWRG